jgi:hypothetical protein
MLCQFYQQHEYAGQQVLEGGEIVYVGIPLLPLKIFTAHFPSHMIADCVVVQKKIGALCCFPRCARNQRDYWFVKIFIKRLHRNPVTQALRFSKEFCFATCINILPKDCDKDLDQPSSSRSFQQFLPLTSVRAYLIHKLNKLA